MPKINLTIVSQEKELLSTEVDSVTAPAAEGEVTILASHLPLFTQLQAGILTYRIGREEQQVVLSKGFLDVAPNSEVTVMVDTAVDARDISVDKAEKAIAEAHEKIANPRDQRELQMAEASLRQAMLEIKIARSSKKALI